MVPRPETKQKIKGPQGAYHSYKDIILTAFGRHPGTHIHILVLEKQNSNFSNVYCYHKKLFKSGPMYSQQQMKLHIFVRIVQLAMVLFVPHAYYRHYHSIQLLIFGRRLLVILFFGYQKSQFHFISKSYFKNKCSIHVDYS